MRRRRTALVVFSVIVLLMSGLGVFSAQAAPQANLVWSAGSLGGGWYTMAGAIAEMIAREAPGIQIRVIPGGGLQNVPLVHTGQADLAWGLPPFARDGYNGEEPFDQRYDKVRAIAGNLGENVLHFLAGADTPYETIEDLLLNGGRIGVERVGVSDELTFRRITAFYGVDYDDIRRRGGGVFHAGYGDQANMYRNRNVDAILSQLAVPGASVMEATTARTGRLLPFPEDLQRYLNEHAYTITEIPAGSYDNVVNNDVAIPSSGIGNVIMVSADVPDDVVYEITRILNENVDQLHSIHSSLRSYSPAVGWKDTGVPLHPGAERYYREAGLME